MVSMSGLPKANSINTNPAEHTAQRSNDQSFKAMMAKASLSLVTREARAEAATFSTKIEGIYDASLSPQHNACGCGGGTCNVSC